MTRKGSLEIKNPLDFSQRVFSLQKDAYSFGILLVTGKSVRLMFTFLGVVPSKTSNLVVKVPVLMSGMLLTAGAFIVFSK